MKYVIGIQYKVHVESAGFYSRYIVWDGNHWRLSTRVDGTTFKTVGDTRFYIQEHAEEMMHNLVHVHRLYDRSNLIVTREFPKCDLEIYKKLQKGLVIYDNKLIIEQQE